MYAVTFDSKFLWFSTKSTSSTFGDSCWDFRSLYCDCDLQYILSLSPACWFSVNSSLFLTKSEDINAIGLFVYLFVCVHRMAQEIVDECNEIFRFSSNWATQFWAPNSLVEVPRDAILDICDTAADLQNLAQQHVRLRGGFQRGQTTRIPNAAGLPSAPNIFIPGISVLHCCKSY